MSPDSGLVLGITAVDDSTAGSEQLYIQCFFDHVTED